MQPVTVALRQPMVKEEFLAWEERQELRYEFDGVQAIAMTGGAYEHDAIQVNLVTALATRLRGMPCRAHGNSIKIEVAGRIRYPDAFVTCSPVPRGAMVLYDPVVVFEVLSEGAARTDHLVKNREYASTASIQRYVMLEQGAAVASVFTRVDGNWAGAVVGDDVILDMPEIGISIPLLDLYQGVDLSLEAGEET